MISLFSRQSSSASSHLSSSSSPFSSLLFSSTDFRSVVECLFCLVVSDASSSCLVSRSSSVCSDLFCRSSTIDQSLSSGLLISSSFCLMTSSDSSLSVCLLMISLFSRQSSSASSHLTSSSSPFSSPLFSSTDFRSVVACLFCLVVSDASF